MREKIRLSEYVLTIHAEEEMENDGLSIFDIERVVLNGKIIERQQDKKSAEWKYRIRGKLSSGLVMDVVTKLSITGKLVILTVILFNNNIRLKYEM